MGVTHIVAVFPELYHKNSGYYLAVHLAVAGGVFDGVLLCCLFSPLDCLDEIWDLNV